MKQAFYLILLLFMAFSCKKPKKTEPPVTNNPPPVDSLVASPYARGIDSTLYISYVYDQITVDSCFLIVSRTFNAPYTTYLTKVDMQCETVWQKQINGTLGGYNDKDYIKILLITPQVYTVIIGNEVRQFSSDGTLTNSKSLNFLYHAVDSDYRPEGGQLKFVTTFGKTILCTTYSAAIDSISAVTVTDTNIAKNYACYFRENGDIHLLISKDTAQQAPLRYRHYDNNLTLLDSASCMFQKPFHLANIYRAKNDDIIVETPINNIMTPWHPWIISNGKLFGCSFPYGFEGNYAYGENSGGEVSVVHHMSRDDFAGYQTLYSFIVNASHTNVIKNDIKLDTSIAQPLLERLEIKQLVHEPGTNIFIVFSNKTQNAGFAHLGSMIFKVKDSTSVLW